MNIDHVKIYVDLLMLRGYGKRTIDCYTCIVKKFLFSFKISPEKINEHQIVEYIISYDNANTRAQKIGALRLFYSNIIGQKLKLSKIGRIKKSLKDPEILSQEEVARLIEASKINLKHYCIILTLYSTGVRISELLNIKFEDVDRANMIIRIKQGKGAKDRSVMLSPRLLDVFEKYYYKYKPVTYLFNGAKIGERYTSSSVSQFLERYALIAGIKKHVYPHLLRHCFATHMIERGIDVLVLQDLLGHKNPKTTDRYKHLSTKRISTIKTLID